MSTSTTTPQLQRWIISLIQRGLAPEQLRKVMRVGGWSEAAADEAVC